MEEESGDDASVDIGDIKDIHIVKKSKAGFGFLIGGVIGALAGAASDTGAKKGLVSGGVGAGGSAIGGGVLGGLIGLVIAAVSGKDKTIQIEGKSDSEIQEILEDLRKKARVSDFHDLFCTARTEDIFMNFFKGY